MNWEEILKTIVNDYIIHYGLRILAAFIILVIGFKISKILTNALYNKKKYRFQDETVFRFTVNLLSIAMKIIVFIITASIVGIPSASFVAVLGSAGVAVGLALQGGLSNLAGGVMLVFFKPYSLGDYIEIGDYEGTVFDIGIFYTTILSPDNRKIVIPNSAATSGTIKNYSTEKYAQIIIDLSVSYNDDIKKVKTVLEKIAEAEEKVIHEKPTTIRIKEYAESGINISFRCWCENSDYWDTKNSLFINIKKIFDKEKIEIPYNKLDVQLIEKK